MEMGKRMGDRSVKGNGNKNGNGDEDTRMG